MKYIIFYITFLAITNSYSQKIKEDPRNQLEKEDSNDLYNANDINELDVLEALDLVGVQIHKFDLGEFDRKYNFYLLADEYVHGKLAKTDTLLAYHNQYHYFLEGVEKPSTDYIDQIKIFTRTEENTSTLKIRTYVFGTQKEIGLSKLDNRQFFLWREYKETKWKPEKKIPLMIFASSWLDKEHNFHRFCGVAKLSEGEEGTNELLTSSPNYIVINYKVSEPD
ncbi:MAG: DUF5041 domain-containing protein [Bacteroidota bacterium]